MSRLEKELCEKLYEEYKNRLSWYMRKRFDWINTEDLHDILQDTWCELSKNIQIVGSLEPPQQFDWLMVVSCNKVSDFVRKQKWVADEEDELVEMVLDKKKTFSMEDKIIDMLMLEKLMKSLTKEERKLLYLSEFTPKKNKKSNADICKVYRIRQKLRKLWKEGELSEMQ